MDGEIEEGRTLLQEPRDARDLRHRPLRPRHRRRDAQVEGAGPVARSGSRRSPAPPSRHARRSFEFTVGPDEEGARLDQFLAGQGPAAQPLADQAPHRRGRGAGERRGRQARAPAARRRPRRPSPRRRRPRRRRSPRPSRCTVLYEDAHLIVIDKPAGLVVHPAAGHAARHAGQRAAAPLPRPRGHRRRAPARHRPPPRPDTSGVLVVAKDEPTLLGLQAQFKAHTIAPRLRRARRRAPSPADAGRFETLYGRDPRAPQALHRRR